MSYGKFFASCFTGSMMGAGPDVFAVWAYVIAHAVDGQIELNPRLLSAILGCPVDRVQAALDFLCAPDPESRNKEHDGRRLLRDGQFSFRVVSHSIYRAMRNEDDRRAYNRAKQQESRERRRAPVNDVNDTSAMSAEVSPSRDKRQRQDAEAAAVEPRARIEASETTATPPTRPPGLFDPIPKAPASPAVAPQMPRTARTLSAPDLRTFGLSIVSPDDRQAVDLALQLYGQDAVLEQLRATVAAAAPGAPVYVSALLSGLKSWVLIQSDYERAGLPVPAGTPKE